MFGLSPSHLLILVIILLLFGSRRLPELGASLGKGLNAFKKGLEGKEEEKTLLQKPIAAEEIKPVQNQMPNSNVSENSEKKPS